MDRNQASAREFMVKARQTVRSTPELPTQGEAIRCAALCMEEILETIRDGLGLEPYTWADGDEFISISMNAGIRFQKRQGHEPSLKEIADGIADSLFVLNCLANACGIDMEAINDLVCENNLQKFSPGYSFSETGKLIKSPSHVGPDIAALLAQQAQP